MRSLALVAAGGFVGTLGRFALLRGLPNAAGTFPTATFITNLSGAFILGILLEALVRRGPDEGRRRSVRLLVGTGACGAFTTYSTLALDADQLVRHGRTTMAVSYALGSVILGLVATASGIAIAAGHHRRSQESSRRVRLPFDPDLYASDDATPGDP